MRQCQWYVYIENKKAVALALKGTYFLNIELKLHIMVLNIIPDEVSDMVARDECVIIDVREPFEYEAGHIEGSILAPMYDIFNDISIVKKYEGKKIVLVCSSGHRSYYTGKFLEENGIENVYNLYNGLYGWEIEEKPLV